MIVVLLLTAVRCVCCLSCVFVCCYCHCHCCIVNGSINATVIVVVVAGIVVVEVACGLLIKCSMLPSSLICRCCCCCRCPCRYELSSCSTLLSLLLWLLWFSFVVRMCCPGIPVRGKQRTQQHHPESRRKQKYDNKQQHTSNRDVVNGVRLFVCACCLLFTVCCVCSCSCC